MSCERKKLERMNMDQLNESRDEHTKLAKAASEDDSRLFHTAQVALLLYEKYRRAAWLRASEEAFKLTRSEVSTL